MLEKAIDLVREKKRAVQLGDRDEAMQLFWRELRAGRAVRRVDDDDFRVRAHRSGNGIDVERPVSRIERNERDLGASRPRDLVQRLVRRPHDHRVIARPHERVHAEKHALFGAGERDDVVSA